MSTENAGTKDTGTLELDPSVLPKLANPEADADKMRKGEFDLGPKSGKDGKADDPEKKDDDEDDEKLESDPDAPSSEVSSLDAEPEADGPPAQRSSPMPQGQPRGGGGGGDALSGALAGLIQGTSSVVAQTAKFGGNATLTGARFVNQGFQDRLRRSQQAQLETYLQKVVSSETALEKHLRAHNDKFEPFANHVRELEASEPFQKKFTDELKRRKQAQVHAFKDMPEYESDEVVESFNTSREEIFGLTSDHVDTLSQAQGFEKALEAAPAATQERFREVMERNTDVNNVLENASKAAMLDGQDDPALKERLKEATEKLQEMLRNFIAKFLPKSPAMGK